MNVNGGTIDGSSAADGGVAYLTGSSTVNIKGGQITDCSSSTNGGVVYINTGTLNINGGQIANCSSTYGGAVYAAGGKFYIKGGTISSCSVTGSGGAVYNKAGEVNISNGTISDCKATSNNGGAIYNVETLSISGGTISGCKAVYGGGIDNHGGTLSFTGGTITGCSASNWGGGIYNTSSATATIGGGLIEKCTGSYGAAVSVNDGSLTMNDGEIDQVGSYSAVSTTSNTNAITIKINGGTIKSAAGRAISLAKANATLDITGGTLISESSTGTNNAVYNNLSTVNISGNPTISAVSSAVYSLAGKVNIQGGDIKATKNYGINIVASGTNVINFSISGGKVTSPSGNAAINFPATPQDGSTLTITGGLYSSVSDAMRTYLGSGYQFTDNGDGYQKVVAQ